MILLLTTVPVVSKDLDEHIMSTEDGNLNSGAGLVSDITDFFGNYNRPKDILASLGFFHTKLDIRVATWLVKTIRQHGFQFYEVSLLTEPEMIFLSQLVSSYAKEIFQETKGPATSFFGDLNFEILGFANCIDACFDGLKTHMASKYMQFINEKMENSMRCICQKKVYMDEYEIINMEDPVIPNIIYCAVKKKGGKKK